MSIVVRTLSDQVLEIVRNRIVSGELPTNSVIRQDALAGELGVSKIPLREALARLEQEGLLSSQANRGYSIRPMSIEAAEEIYELRLDMEPRAAARAARLANETERADAIAAFEALDKATQGGGEDIARSNRDFHLALVRPSQRPLTLRLIEQLAYQAERYVVAHLRPAGREDRAHVEHREMLDAWLARDEARTSDLLSGHIHDTLDDLRAELAASPEG